MIETLLRKKLEPITQAETRLRRRWASALVLALAAVVALFFWWQHRQPEAAELSWVALVGLLGAVAMVLAIATAIAGWRKFTARELARRVEDGHPDLQLALLTAVEQEPDADGEFGYLQEQVIGEAINHAVNHDWVRRVSRSRLLGAGFVQALAALAFLIGCGLMFSVSGQRERYVDETGGDGVDLPPELVDFQISVDPGDVEIERGTRLVVEASFGDRLPGQATLVIAEPEVNKEPDPGEEDEKPEAPVERGRVVLKPGLDEHVFGGLVSKVDADAEYWIEYDGERSETFSIATYEHPRLEQADAKITPPAYSGLDPKEIQNTLKVSALEGSDVGFTMQLNKPVAAAELFGEDETIIPLTPSKADPSVVVGEFKPQDTQKYRLHLVDADDRSNKRPPWLTVTVKRNLPPKVEFAFPKRDATVSAIQELPIEAEVWDDLGVTGTGLTLSVHGETRELPMTEGDEPLKGGTKHKLETLLMLEDMKAKPRDLLTYYVWAEDIGPDGATRRSMSDLFFADVRHFEDIFREQEAPPGPPGESGPTDELVKIQKQVINADWKLTREINAGKKMAEVKEDVSVVKDSQLIAVLKVDEALEKVDDKEIQAHLTEAKEHMNEAVTVLEKGLAVDDASSVEKAMTPERQAYEALLRAQSREHNVSRAKNPSQGKGQPQEQQLMQLEMKQEDQRYEEQSQAQDEAQSAEQEENLVVLNRLAELAKRQEALAEKIKELEAQLQEAESEQEREELRKQLKRLQEEQEQLLRELDTLMERMDEPDNRANMAEEREQLEKTRENVREAAEKLAEGEEKLAEAANAATRAERELDEVKEEFREKTARRFAEEMKGVRDQARQLAENQQAIAEQMEKAADSNPNDPFDQKAQRDLSDSLQNQSRELAQMLESMRQISEASEEGEPLLSDALYEAVREAKTGGLEQKLAETSDWARFNRMDEARESESAVGRGIEDLKSNVEKAAERVLGSESEALRAARSELDNLIRQVEEETANSGEKLAMNDRGEDEDQQPGEGESRESGEGQGKGEGQEPGEGQGKGDIQKTGYGQANYGRKR